MTVLRDAIGLAGAGLVVAGFWDIARPAGLIVGGIILLAGAIAWARRG
ncbi:hypothetical protein [Alteraurantiacibacter palmitatis]|uniref:LPXTG cell wall anchor domain-containing protein n=1 Tax=Alteraurantiacibacter palmitatis TaxID=2054628 RepID=A0ABV7E4A5_9SPHN